jgi:hypothetical protein
VIAEVRFKTGMEINNNIVTPVSNMIIRLLQTWGYQTYRVNSKQKSYDYRRRDRLVGTDYTKFIARYGPVANKHDEEARHMLALDQVMYKTFIAACKDAVEYCKKYPPDWKISVKDIIQMTRLKYRIKDANNNEHRIEFGNSMITHIAKMIMRDVPGLTKLVNGPRKLRKKHDLDAEAELVVPEALIGAFQ